MCAKRIDVVVDPSLATEGEIMDSIQAQLAENLPGIDNSAVQDRDTNGKLVSVCVNLPDTAGTTGLEAAALAISGNNGISTAIPAPRFLVPLEDYELFSNAQDLQGETVGTGLKKVTYSLGDGNAIAETTISYTGSTDQALSGTKSAKCSVATSASYVQATHGVAFTAHIHSFSTTVVRHYKQKGSFYIPAASDLDFAAGNTSGQITTFGPGTNGALIGITSPSLLQFRGAPSSILQNTVLSPALVEDAWNTIEMDINLGTGAFSIDINGGAQVIAGTDPAMMPIKLFRTGYVWFPPNFNAAASKDYLVHWDDISVELLA